MGCIALRADTHTPVADAAVTGNGLHCAAREYTHTQGRWGGDRSGGHEQAMENALAPADDIGQGGTGALLKDRLVKEVGTRVAGEAKLGKNQDATPSSWAPGQKAKDALDIESTIRHPQSRHRSGNADETMVGHAFIIMGK